MKKHARCIKCEPSYLRYCWKYVCMVILCHGGSDSRGVPRHFDRSETPSSLTSCSFFVYGLSLVPVLAGTKLARSDQWLWVKASETPERSACRGIFGSKTVISIKRCAIALTDMLYLRIYFTHSWCVCKTHISWAEQNTIFQQNAPVNHKIGHVQILVLHPWFV